MANNKLSSLPTEIGNLINLQQLYLNHNQLNSLPTEILSIKNKIYMDQTSYQINNLDMECKILIFNQLDINISNLPRALALRGCFAVP